MAFVLDASVTACWAFDDEDHPTPARLSSECSRRGRRARPVVVRSADILIVNERRRRIAESDTAAFLLNLSLLRLRADSRRRERRPSLARSHRLSVYDAAYLELARREGLPLATLDGDLRKAAASEGGLVTHGSETP